MYLSFLCLKTCNFFSILLKPIYKSLCFDVNLFLRRGNNPAVYILFEVMIQILIKIYFWEIW